MRETDPRAEKITGVTAAATGLGVITFALFPFAVPITILTVVALLPLALPLIPLAMLGAIVAGIWIAVRAVVRAVRRPRMRRPVAITGEEQLT